MRPCCEAPVITCFPSRGCALTLNIDSRQHLQPVAKLLQTHTHTHVVVFLHMLSPLVSTCCWSVFLLPAVAEIICQSWPCFCATCQVSQHAPPAFCCTHSTAAGATQQNTPGRAHTSKRCARFNGILTISLFRPSALSVSFRL